MLEKSVGVVVGSIVAFVVVAAVEFLGKLLVPLPPTSGIAAEQWVASVPLAMKVFVVVAWAFGAFVGAILATRIGEHATVGWIPAMLVGAAAIANVAMVAHPLWMVVAAVLAPVAGGWIGARLARR